MSAAARGAAGFLFILRRRLSQEVERRMRDAQRRRMSTSSGSIETGKTDMPAKRRRSA